MEVARTWVLPSSLRRGTSSASSLVLVQGDLRWISTLQNFEIIHMCCVSHQVRGNQFRQSEETNRGGYHDLTLCG